MKTIINWLRHDEPYYDLGYCYNVQNIITPFMFLLSKTTGNWDYNIVVEMGDIIQG